MVAELQAEWREATIDLRADSAARRLVEVLPSHPIVSARSVSEVLGVSEQAAPRPPQASWAVRAMASSVAGTSLRLARTRTRAATAPTPSRMALRVNAEV
jgi:hypothetical protein